MYAFLIVKNPLNLEPLMEAKNKVTHSSDWKRSPYQITDVHLKFELDEEVTFVIAELKISAAKDKEEEERLVLNGEDLELDHIAINGKSLDASAYNLEEKTLTINTEEADFVLEIKTKICPTKNTQLSGLYKSGDILCTQNEAEGFRRITYFIDRPDIMSRYSVEMIGDKKKYPYLLSNGNLIESGYLANGLHYAKWQDPFLKPCYLFALVAGDFGLLQDYYITKSGRKIELKIYCDKGNEEKCRHAMVSLKKAMRWDEDVFGLEYDLDLFMIVAVLSFNFGAMENKGLNIFNANAILADPATSTDDNFMRVERVVAHEYFHNWTGNRVTLRDWFQLTLKEGLTVFRDQEFTQDMHNRGVQRIEDVYLLRRHQFPEDSGPTRHPIKPDSYIKIDNFYTTTIYQKGAEIIRMIKTLLGEALFRKGMDIYFELYDGMAVTTEDFIRAMEQAYGKSLQDFSRWYQRSGTPVIHVKKVAKEKGISLEIEQKLDLGLEPLAFPLAVGFIDHKGSSVALKNMPYRTNQNTAILTVSKEREEFFFEKVPKGAVFSVNRDFSAPISVESTLSKPERLHLMRYDADSFSRWDAAHELYLEGMLEMVASHKKGHPLSADPELLIGIETLLNDKNLDPSYLSLMLSLPSEGEIGERQAMIDVEEIHAAREYLKKSIGKTHYHAFLEIWNTLAKDGDPGINTKAMGQRKLKNTALAFLAATREKEALDLVFTQFENAKNMTDQLASLELLANYENPYREQALASFYAEWKEEPLVITKWFAAQSASQLPKTKDCVEGLLRHPCYDEKVPNNVRALLGAFTQNQVHFHDASGSGYKLISEQIIHLDRINPYVAAGMTQGFKKIAKLDPKRQGLMQSSLEDILKAPNLSANVFEIASKCVQR